MKKFLIPCLLLCMLFKGVMAESPSSFKYQAIVRDNSGNVIANQNIGIRLSILKNNVSGSAVYVETHVATSSSLGLINLEIGTGTPVSGSMENIDWGNDAYFIKIEMDAAGGSAYNLVGVSQLVSVPYALYANKAANGTQWKDTLNNIYYDAGKVGIGTSNPKTSLEVRDAANRGGRVTITGNIPSLRLSDTAYTGNGVIIGVAADSNDMIPRSGKGDLVFTNEAYNNSGGYIFGSGTPSEPCVKITDDCKVGIGTDQPVAKLDVRGDINLGDAGTGVVIKSPDGSCWKLTVNNLGAPIFTSVSCLTLLQSDSSNSFGAVASYRFNGNANDVTGNGYNGSVTGATLAAGRRGEPNSAYHFSNGSQFIDLPNFGAMIGNDDEFTISLWSKAETQQSNTVFALNPDIANDRILGHVNYFTSNNVTKIVFDVGNFSSGRHELLNQPYTTVWEHYVFVASKTLDIIKVYRNGVLIIDETGYIVANKSRTLRLAAPFFGFLDEVKIFKRPLSASEVLNIYNSEK